MAIMIDAFAGTNEEFKKHIKRRQYIMGICLDRFAQGLKDTQSGEPELAGHCKHCDQPIYIDEEHVIFEDEVFCDVYCFARYMGAEEVN